MYSLGKLLLMEEYEGFDPKNAVQYLTSAAEQGNEYARQLLEQIKENTKWAVMSGALNLFFSAACIVQNRIMTP